MIMVTATRIERGVAVKAAGIIAEVVRDGKGGAARAAEDSKLVPFRLGPGLERMVGERIVAVFTGVEEAAAFHFDGDDVERRVVMEAAGLRIEIQAANF
jgi:hypothetical protein